MNPRPSSKAPLGYVNHCIILVIKQIEKVEPLPWLTKNPILHQSFVHAKSLTEVT